MTKKQELYQQILDAVEQLVRMTQDDTEEDETAVGEEEDKEEGTDQERMLALLEEAAERGLDEDSTERLLKAVNALVKKSRDI